MTMKRTVIITIIAVVISSVALMIFARLTSDKDKTKLDFAEAQKGSFEISVSTTGDLEAEQSYDIKGPDIVKYRLFRASPLKITDLIQEGSIVRKGDYIATLDRSDYENVLKDELSQLEVTESDLSMKVLDTAVTLTTLRDDIKNQIFAVEEAKITVDKSKYEPPSVQRQAALDLEKEQRTLDWNKKLYSLRDAQCRLDVKNLRIANRIQIQKVKELQAVLKEFTIKAPSDGIVLYIRDRLGAKYQAGTVLNPFNPIVATLPDLNSLMSKMYISEIDISKVRPGLPVQIKIDAFKDRIFNGEVTSVANIGEQLSNSDSKVFEVLARFNHLDPSFKPLMTTNNKVIIKTFSNVVYVPLESVHTGADSIPFVYTKEGRKQIVIPGDANDKNIIIEKGLAEGTSVYLSTPDKYDRFRLSGMELISELRERQAGRYDEKTKPVRRILANDLETETGERPKIN